MLVGILAPGKRKAAKLLTAFTRPARGVVMPVDRIRRARLGADLWVFYGVDAVTLPLFEVAAARGSYVYIDNGYLRSKYQGEVHPFYRITRGAPQHSGIGRSDGRRFADLGVTLSPWREDGRHVLIALQSEWWFSRHGLNRADWLFTVQSFIKRRTGRPVVVRDKPPRIDLVRPIAEDLRGAWCVVTHSSNVAIDAIVAGIPAVVFGVSAAAPMAGRTLEDILDPPVSGDRLNWCGVLADNQWRMHEIGEGLPLEVIGGGRARRGHGR